MADEPTATTPARKLAYRIGIAAKLSLLVGVLTLVFVGLLAIVVWVDSSRLLQDQLNMRLSTIVLLQYQQLNNYFTGLAENAQLISNRVLIQNYLRVVNNGSFALTSQQYEAGVNDLASAILSLPGLLGVSIYPRNSTAPIFFANNTILDVALITTLKPASIPTAPASLLNANHTPPVTVISPASDDSPWSISIPVYNSIRRDDAPLGMITLILNTAALDTFLSFTSGLGQSGQLLLGRPLNTTYYTFVIPPRNSSVHVGDAMPFNQFPAMASALSGKTDTIDNISFNGEHVLASFHPLDFGDWCIVAQTSVSEIYSPIANLRVIIVIATLLTLLFAALAAILFSRLITAPIDQLVRVSNAFREGDLQARAANDKTWWPDQLTELQLVFNAMADRIGGQYAWLERTVEERTRELQEATRAADAASAAKSRFLANMSHEIRTPLNAIVNISRLCLEDEEGVRGDSRRLLELLRASGDHLLTLVHAVLDASRIEAGAAEPSSQPFRLRRMVNQLRSMFYITSKQKGINFTCTVEPTVPDHLRGDSRWLMQILVNIVGNAFKFTSAGGVIVKVKAISVRRTSAAASSHAILTPLPTLRDDGSDSDRTIADPLSASLILAPSNEDTVVLEFITIDTGIGIPADRHHLLFKSFSQLDSSHSRKFGGTGLGLAISKQLVELMGGTLWFESTTAGGSNGGANLSGQVSGTTFFIRLPFTRVHAEEARRQENEESEEFASASRSKPGEPLSILLAEDNAINQEIAKRILTKLGHRVVIAVNGLEVVAKFQRSIGLCQEAVSEGDQSVRFDVILMDVQMPEMDGIAATERIRTIESEHGLIPIPIVALTAHALSSDQEVCLRAGMDGFVTKPIDIKALKNALEDVVKDAANAVEMVVTENVEQAAE